MGSKRIVGPDKRYPRVIETYNVPWGIERVQTAPSCFNGIIQVERYRITVEKIDESPDVIRDRLVALWRTSEHNWHHTDPMRRAAQRLLGITRAEADELLKSDEQGIDFKHRGAFTP